MTASTTANSAANLGDLVEIQPGYQFRRKVEANPEGNAFLVQLKDLGEAGDYHPHDLVRISAEDIPVRYEVDLGDVLLPSRGTYSFSAIVRSKPGKLIAGGYFYRLRTRGKKLDPAFLCWFLNSRSFQRSLAVHKRGTNIPSLELEGLKGLTMPVPPIKLQQQVGKVYTLSQEKARLERRLQELSEIQLEERLLELVHNFQ